MADLSNCREGAGHVTDAVSEGTPLPADCTARKRHREVLITVRLGCTDERVSEWAEFASLQSTGDALNDTALEEGREKKVEVLSEAAGALWNGIDSTSSVQNWANFSPVTTKSHSEDTWVQCDDSGEDPFIRRNWTIACENSEISKDSVSSTGWHAFGLGEDHTHMATPTVPWPDGVQSDRDSNASTNLAPTSVTCRTDGPVQSASPQHHHHCHPCTTVFRHCFASSQEGTECSGEGGGVSQLVATGCTGGWLSLKDDRCPFKTSLHNNYYCPYP